MSFESSLDKQLRASHVKELAAQRDLNVRPHELAHCIHWEDTWDPYARGRYLLDSPISSPSDSVSLRVSPISPTAP